MTDKSLKGHLCGRKHLQKCPGHLRGLELKAWASLGLSGALPPLKATQGLVNLSDRVR